MFFIFWLNAFPTVNTGVSRKYSPRELVLRSGLQKALSDFVQVSYCECEVHEEPDPSNCMVPRTHAAIVLGPSGNLRGTVEF